MPKRIAAIRPRALTIQSHINSSNLTALGAIDIWFVGGFSVAGSGSVRDLLIGSMISRFQLALQRDPDTRVDAAELYG